MHRSDSSMKIILSHESPELYDLPGLIIGWDKIIPAASWPVGLVVKRSRFDPLAVVCALRMRELNHGRGILFLLCLSNSSGPRCAVN